MHPQFRASQGLKFYQYTIIDHLCIDYFFLLLIANFSDRSLLKNLGHWLGLITLARNQPILMVDLDFKPLIIEAYHNGQQELLYVVPFVAKVIESCAKSKVIFTIFYTFLSAN